MRIAVKFLLLLTGTHLLVSDIGTLAFYILNTLSSAEHPSPYELEPPLYFITQTLPSSLVVGGFLVWAGLSRPARRRLWRTIGRLARDHR